MLCCRQRVLRMRSLMRRASRETSVGRTWPIGFRSFTVPSLQVRLAAATRGLLPRASRYCFSGTSAGYCRVLFIVFPPRIRDYRIPVQDTFTQVQPLTDRVGMGAEGALTSAPSPPHGALLFGAPRPGSPGAPANPVNRFPPRKTSCTVPTRLQAGSRRRRGHWASGLRSRAGCPEPDAAGPRREVQGGEWRRL